jgi:copper chaperone CopZ
MTHIYQISGMTCEACEATVKTALEEVPGVTSARPDRSKNEVEITMSTHIATGQLQAALKDSPKYKLKDVDQPVHAMPVEEEKTWFETYKPVLLLFLFITGVSLLAELRNPVFDWMHWMSLFMAGFFISFSFFKILNLQGFADSYATYDIIARRWRGYGYLYAFIELALGLAFLTGFSPVITNAVTFIVMSISLVGVLQSVLNKRKIKCACLGDVFNIPMSTVTILEDLLMILMSAIMLIVHFL